MNTWTVTPSTSFPPAANTAPPPPPTVGAAASLGHTKPRVGLGVVCRCQPTCVQCLLVRRGRNFVSPLKWSFPGGRLDEEGDLEDDGEIGTARELTKECGGGEPIGLPPLIHIECYKSGKTFYHVYVVDWEAHPEWTEWVPAATMQHTGDVDTSVTQLCLQGQLFTSEKGFCWVDLQTLAEECIALGNDQDKINTSELQHGLIRWIAINGENILKTLIARSPKLAHHRRSIASATNPTSTSLSSSSSSSPSNANSTNSTPHLNAGMPRNVPLSSGRTGEPPILPGQMYRPPVQFVNVPMIHPSILAQQQQGGMNVHLLTLLQQQQQHQTPANVLLSNGTSFPTNQAAAFNQQQSSAGSPIANSKGELEGTASGTHLDGMIEGSHTVDTNQGFSVRPPTLTASFNAIASQNASLVPPTGNGGEMMTGVGQFDHRGVVIPASVLEEHVRRQQSRKETLCKYFIQGHCPYGDNCWFMHPMEAKPRHREPLLGPGGILTSAMHPHPGLWQPGLLSPDEYSQLVAASGAFSPPQSPAQVQSPVSPTAWQMAMGSRPLLFPLPRGGLPIPGQQPFYRPMLGPRYFPPPQQSMLPNFQDPVLRFKLLSEVTVRDSNDAVITSLSHLTVRADHFYLSFKNVVRDYKVLFGGERHYSDSHVLTAEQQFQKNVTCLHSSKLTPSLVIVGMNDGSIFTWDLKRGGMNSILLPVHETEPATSEGAITSLIHFTTTMSGAQVVVAGSKLGVVSWYISQPPMKTFTLLSSESNHSPSPVCSLQILGGYLISGSENGMVCLWSMRSHEPTLAEKFQAHSESLKDVYVLDTTTFLTVGFNHGVGVASPIDQVNLLARPPHLSSSATSASSTLVGKDAVDTLTAEMSKFSLPSNHSLTSSSSTTTLEPQSAISIWLFGQPVHNVKNIDNIGQILCTAYHQQPMFGNRFLAVGLTNGGVRVYNIPTFSVASEINFPEINDLDCRFIALNLSRDKENTHYVNVKNPFRDLILTTSWSDGKVMICQIDARRGSS